MGVTITLRGKDEVSKAIKSVGSSLDNLRGQAGTAVTKGLAPLKTMLIGGIASGAAAAGAGLAALTATIVSGTRQAADMEQAIADIAATMGLGADETKKLKDLISDLGLDPKLKVSSVEAADAIEMLGKNGLAMGEILGGAARNTVLLANSTSADFAVAADIATDVMSLFNIQAADMANAVNGITGVTKSSKFDINDYGLAIAQAGGVAATVGVDFDDFNAVIAGISPSFASGSDAGTSFKTMLQRLVPGSNAAADAMAALGIITEDGSNRFFDANGNMQSMGEIAGILSGALGGLSEEQKINALSTIFGTDAMRAAAAMADLGTERFSALKATIANTNAEESAAVRMDTLRGAMEILSGVIETIRIKIGDQFIPVVRRMTESFTAFLSENQEDVLGFFSMLAERVGVAVDWMLKVADAAFAVFDAHGYTWSALGEIWNIAAGQFMDLLGKLMQSAIDQLPAWRAKLGEWGQAAWEWIKNVTPDVLIHLGAWSAALFAWVIDQLPAWRAKLGEWKRAAWEWIRDAIPDLLSHSREWATSLIGEIAAHLPAWKSNFTEWAKVSWEWVKNAIPDALKSAKDWATDLVKEITSHLPAWREGLGEWSKAAWQWVQDSIPTVKAKLGEWSSNLFDHLRSLVTTWREKLSGWGWAAWEWIQNTIPMVRTKLTEWFASIRTWLDANRPVLEDKLGSWSYSLYSWISNDRTRNGTVQALNSWKEQSLWSQLGTLDHQLGLRMADMEARLYEWIANAAPKAITAMTDWLIGLLQGIDPQETAAQREMQAAQERINQAMKDMVAAIGQSLAENAKRLGPYLWQGFRDGLFGGRGEAEAAAEETSRSVLQRFRDVFRTNSPSLAMFDIGRDVVAGLRDGIRNLAGDAGTAANDVAWSALRPFNDVLNWEHFHSLGKYVMSGLVSGLRDMAWEVQQAASDVAGGAVDRIRALLGINSPSRVMMAIGEQTMEGYQIGLQSMMPEIVSAMDALRPDSTGGTVVNNSSTTYNVNLPGNLAKSNDSILEDVRIMRSLYGGA